MFYGTSKHSVSLHSYTAIRYIHVYVILIHANIWDYMYIYIYMYIYMYVYIWIYLHVYIYAYIDIYVCIHMHICMYVYMYTPHLGIMKTGKNGGDSYSAAIVTITPYPLSLNSYPPNPHPLTSNFYSCSS
jgi:hypothetical protein